MKFVPGLVLLAAVLTGCGGSSSSDLSAAAESLLQRDADTLASAARCRIDSAAADRSEDEEPPHPVRTAARRTSPGTKFIG